MSDTSPEALAALRDDLTAIEKEFIREAELGRTRVLNVARAKAIVSAANAIEALAADVDAARAAASELARERTAARSERDRLAAQVAELREALAPLVDAYARFEVAQGGYYGNQQDAYNIIAKGGAKWVTAAAALANTAPEGDGNG